MSIWKYFLRLNVCFCFLFLSPFSCYRPILAIPVLFKSSGHPTQNGEGSTTLRENGTVLIVEGDIAIPTRPRNDSTEGGASFSRFAHWPERPAGSKTYEAVYNLDSVAPEMREKIKWVWKYLERGTNIRFREANPGETFIVTIFHGEGCYSDAAIPGRLSLGMHCDSLHTIAHETLHSLGVMHEHQREDRGTHLILNGAGLSPGWLQQVSTDAIGIHTPYDYASIMHYAESVAGSGQRNLIVTQEKYRKLITSRRTWLSRCDWTVLNLMYPGKRKPPKCQPHKIPDLLVPAERNNRWAVVYYPPLDCLYGNERWFEKGVCVFKTTQATYPAMPTIEEELGFNPEEYTDSEEAKKGGKKHKKKKHHQKKTKSKKKKGKDKGSELEKNKVTTETDDGVKDSDSEEAMTTESVKGASKSSKDKDRKKDGDDTDSADGGEVTENVETEDDKKPKNKRSRTLGKRLRRRRYATGKSLNCKSLISIDPSRMSDQQCQVACSKGCKKYFPDVSLRDCLSSRYYICLPTETVLGEPSTALPLPMLRFCLSVFLIFFLLQ